MNKAYKFRIYPNSEQQIMFAKTFGCVRFIYNHMLADKIKHYEETKQKLNNTPAQYKNEFDWLKEVDSLALANAQMNLQTAFNNCYETTFVKQKFRQDIFLSLSTALATLLYGDWLPQVNGSPRILFVFHRGSLFTVPSKLFRR